MPNPARDPRIHRFDERKGRASVYRLWALCGKPFRTRFVTRKPTEVTCVECHNRMAQELKEMIQGRRLKESFTQ